MSADYHKDLDRWIPRLERAAGGRLDLKAVAQAVRTLSMGLTRERELAGARYMDDPKLLAAYLLFYWPVSYAQAREVLGEVGARPRSVLDLGSGPGPMAFAALDAGAADVTAADRSTRALDLAKKLATDAEEGIATREWTPEKPLPDGQFDLISMGHLLNELPEARRVTLVEAALAKLRPKGSVVIIEPALRDTSRGLLKLRDALVAKGYAVRAPCLFRGNCPALVREGDWCHAERSWRMPQLVENLARLAQLHKEALKMSYLVLAPKGEAWRDAPPGRVFRIVSEQLEGKGRQRFMGCGPEGRVGVALQHKHVSPTNEAFMHLNRGDVIEVTGTEPKGDGVALGEGSAVKVIAPAGKPVP
ncbi:MAG: methyltransferase domain-containing protein [Archangiaceae bacterium]|nr:methyltransferase domain-containing protein [Archangiaceae bacterium]